MDRKRREITHDYYLRSRLGRPRRRSSIYNLRHHYDTSNSNNNQESSDQYVRNITQRQHGEDRPQPQHRRERSQPQRTRDRPQPQHSRDRSQQQDTRDRSQQQDTRDGSQQQDTRDRSQQQYSSDRSERHHRRHRCQRRHRRHKSLSSSVSCSPVSGIPDDMSDDVKCVICLDTVEDPKMKFIRCGHGFHKKCCNNWLKVSNACPVCRTVVSPRRSTFNIRDITSETLIENIPISEFLYFFTLSVFNS